ncbi:MAG: hypothetical protein ND895_17375 [Pyrinomonadaceae bacterium]|nr:hypothetical protein [Pyrinomonadaceae bacterium]
MRYLLTRTFMVLLVVLTVFPLALAQQAQDAAEQARAELCKRLPCRPSTIVRLRLNREEQFEMEFPVSPYVADGFINVLASEELNVEFDDSDGKLSNPRYVKTVVKPERTILLRLEQTAEGTILTVNNPFAKDIVYDCLIQHYKEQRLQKTSVIPVRGNLKSFEMWPYPVAQVVISNVRYSPAK